METNEMLSELLLMEDRVAMMMLHSAVSSQLRTEDDWLKAGIAGIRQIRTALSRLLTYGMLQPAGSTNQTLNYEPTRRGIDFAPVLLELERWAVSHSYNEENQP